MKITLPLSGMQFVEFSTSVDAFRAVVMFIRWSEHYSRRTKHGVHTFFNVLHISLVLVGTGITYLFSSISPRVTQFFESLSVFSWKEGERRWYIQWVRYIIAMTTDKSATMLPPTEDTFNQHILRAKFHIFIWCKSHIPNQELIEPVGHSWSACDDGLVTRTMHTRASTPVEFETWHIHTVQTKKVWMSGSALAC